MIEDETVVVPARWQVTFQFPADSPYADLNGNQRRQVDETLFDELAFLQLPGGEPFLVEFDPNLDLDGQTELTRQAVNQRLMLITTGSPPYTAGPPGGMYYELVDGKRKCKGHFVVVESGTPMHRSVETPAGSATAAVKIGVSMDA